MRKETTIILVVVLALSAVGVVSVFSASPAYTNVTGRFLHRDMFHFLWRQALFVGAGLAGMLAAAKFDYHLFTRRYFFWPLMAVSGVLLVLVLVIGIEIGNARRWISLPGFTIQPSELAKLAMIVYLGVKLSENQDQVKSFWRGFVPNMGVAALMAGLVVLERDLSTPTIMAAVAVMMVFMAGARLWHVCLSGLAAAGCFVALCIASPYRMDRIIAFRDPWKYRFDEGLQLIQSLSGFARGGLWGKGLGAGEQKLHYLPEANTDFIFAVWGEEMGLVGTLGLVALFTILLVVGLRIALCAPDLLGSMLAAGIVTMVCLQAAINIGVTTGVFPTTGLPLPFISSGGSSLIVTLTMMGMLMNIGMQAVEPEPGGRLAPARA